MTAVFRLSAMDALFSFSNHPLVHFFENKAQARDFMPTAKLKDTLYYALKSFPILTGHIQKTANGLGMAIIVDENNPNLPGFIETSSNVHFNACSEAMFSWKKWPRNVASTGFITAPGKEGTIKLLNIHVVRLKDNSGLILFCNIPHYVLDGIGYYEFLCHWALLCKEECDSKQTRNVSSKPPTTPFTFDRLLFRRHLRGQRRPLDSGTQKFLTNKTCISSIFAKLPYKLQTRLASTASRVICANAHYFHVSNAALEELYNLYRSKHESNADLDSSSLSSCAVLTSLFCTSIIQAHIDKGKHRNTLLQKSISALGSIFSSTDTFMIVNCIHAHRLVKMNNCQYVGNPMFMQLAFGSFNYSQDNNAASVFADAVYNIHTKARDVDPSLLGELYDMLEANSTVYAKLATYIAMGRPLLTFIDERDYRIGDIDFGWGSSSWVSALPWNMPNFVAFFANQQSSGGVFVYASLRDKILRNMLKSEFFTKYTQLLY